MMNVCIVSISQVPMSMLDIENTQKTRAGAKMKIGIVTGPYLDRVGTSMGRYTNNLIKSLVKINTDHDIYLIHSRKSDSPLYKSHPGLLIPELPLPLPYGIKTFHLPFMLRKHKFDVIHYPAGMAYLSWMTNCKNIATLHSVDSLILPQYYPRMSQFTWLARKFDYKRMDSIITVSESEKNDIVRALKIPEERITVVYHGLEHERFRILKDAEAVKEEINQKYGVGSFILQVANYFPVKNIPGLIKAFWKAKRQGVSHKLVIAGGKRWKYEEILKTIEELNLQKEVVLTGSVAGDDLVKLYNAADLVVLPSLYESFGLPILEAMACGTPVITSNVYSMPEVAGDAAILVDPNDPDDIANAIYKVLTNDGLRNEMIKKGLDRVKEFTWEKCARETLKVYEDVQ